MDPAQMLHNLYFNDGSRFGSSARTCSRILRDFENDWERTKSDSCFVFGPPTLSFRVELEIVLRRSPDLAIVVWSACGDSVGVRCDLEGGRFVVREVVCCDAPSREGEMFELVRGAYYGRTPLDLRTVADVSAIIAAKEKWLRDAYNPGTPKELTPLH